MHPPAHRDGAPQPGRKALRCLVVDDSPEVVRQLEGAVKRILPGATLLPSALDGHEALRRIRDYSPNLLLLDLDMPRMDGVTTLRALGRRRAVTTIAVASESLEGGRAVWEALALGADDFITKRAIRSSGLETEMCDRIDERLREVIDPLIGPATRAPVALRLSPATEEEMARLSALVFLIETRHLRRIATLLSRCGSRFPIPIVLQVPHPPRFTRAIHEGLDRLATMPVRVAVSGERLAPGQAVLVPGRFRGELIGEPGELCLELRPMKENGSSADRRIMMLRSLLCSQAAPIGVAFAGPLPVEIANRGAEAAAQRRLFCVPIERGVETDSALRVVDALRSDSLTGVLS